MACCAFAVFIIGQIYGLWSLITGKGVGQDEPVAFNRSVDWHPAIFERRRAPVLRRRNVGLMVMAGAAVIMTFALLLGGHASHRDTADLLRSLPLCGSHILHLPS